MDEEDSDFVDDEDFDAEYDDEDFDDEDYDVRRPIVSPVVCR